MKTNLTCRTLFAFFGLLLVFYAAAIWADENSFSIEGYPGEISVVQGGEIGFHISSTAPKFSVEITRLGSKNEVVWNKKNLPGQLHPVPEDASANGCGWPETLRVPIDPKWKSGYYTATFTITDGGGKWTQRNRRTASSDTYFVVRPAEPGKNSKVLLQICSNTYNAYNNWGGFSVYAYNSLSKNQGSKVSFERPARSQFSSWEQPFIIWCEENGYELDYATNGDLEFRPEILEKYNLVLSVGHDEYWSTPMRDNLEAYIAKGGNVAFFSGNSICWQVRSEDEGKAFTCFKANYHMDPVFQTRDFKTLSTAWSHHLLERTENSLTGVGFIYGGYRGSHGQFLGEKAAYKVHRPDHWVFEGTDLKRDDEFGGKDTIVGYEADGCELTWKDGLPIPTYKDGTPKSFQILSSCPVKWHPDDAEWYERWEIDHTGNACMGIYTQGGTVFTAATTDWAHGLKGKDKHVEQITRNVLDRLSKSKGK